MEWRLTYYDPILTAFLQLNFCDPPAYHEIYSNNSKLTKYPFMYKVFGEDETSFGYCDPQLARRRREVLNPLFSRRNIISMQGLINDKVSAPQLIIKRDLLSSGMSRWTNYGRNLRSTMAQIKLWTFRRHLDAQPWI